MTKNPITRNTFRYCRVRFCRTTFLETAVYEKFIVSMLRLLQVNERSHIPYGKKRAFILTNETRLLG